MLKPQSNIPVGRKVISYSHSKQKDILISSFNGTVSKSINLFGAVILENFDDFSIVGPIVGSPLAALIAETLFASGAQEISIFGVCGALRPALAEIKIGDVILPTACISEEGTSPLYGLEKEIPFPDSSSQSELQEKLPKSYQGKVWTTDAPFMESFEKAKHYSQLGAVGVEMELAGFLAASSKHNKTLSASYVVSDILDSDYQSGFKEKAFKNSLIELSKILTS